MPRLGLASLLGLVLSSAGEILVGSHGVATRPHGGQSRWDTLEEVDGIVDTRQPRSSGDPHPQDDGNPHPWGQEIDYDSPPLWLNAKLCDKPYKAGSTTTIDLGPTRTIAAENRIITFGYKARCEITCGFADGREMSFVWEQYDSSPQRRSLSECAGARTLHIAGGGYCGGCWLDGHGVRTAHLPPPAPPFPPGLAPMPPPSWPPSAPPALVDVSALVTAGYTFVVLILAFLILRRRRLRALPPRRTLSSTHPISPVAPVVGAAVAEGQLAIETVGISSNCAGASEDVLLDGPAQRSRPSIVVVQGTRVGEPMQYPPLLEMVTSFRRHLRTARTAASLSEAVDAACMELGVVIEAWPSISPGATFDAPPATALAASSENRGYRARAARGVIASSVVGDRSLITRAHMCWDQLHAVP
jgi:hypothetical protein